MYLSSLSPPSFHPSLFFHTNPPCSHSASALQSVSSAACKCLSVSATMVPLSPLDTPAWTHLQHSVHRHHRAQPPFPIAHAVPHALTLFGKVPPAIHDARTCGRVPNPTRLPPACPVPAAVVTIAHATFIVHPLRPSLPHLARQRRREWAARMSRSAARARINRVRDSKDALERRGAFLPALSTRTPRRAHHSPTDSTSGLLATSSLSDDAHSFSFQFRRVSLPTYPFLFALRYLCVHTLPLISHVAIGVHTLL
ncbi:hypothetical protein B0H16DRAFT_822939 [Mycena metata]|uniref:Uncharacterized protein n=1 Tax=Mycena metata TaxID=1033252 RepID=A0AAD7IW07_9AGAR|nr:hypothetical protein B0H16DRAFT_822939 [Mycena metata]